MSKHPAYNVNRTFNGNYAFSSHITQISSGESLIVRVRW